MITLLLKVLGQVESSPIHLKMTKREVEETQKDFKDFYEKIGQPLINNVLLTKQEGPSASKWLGEEVDDSKYRTLVLNNKVILVEITDLK